jgi:5-methylcytosine-specific restriction endonuclease McrA
MKFSLDRHRIDKISKEEMVSELKRVAEFYDFRRFSGREFDIVSTLCKRAAVIKAFVSWDIALEATGLNLKPHRNKRKDTIPEVELFREMEHVWRLLGHRPSKTEWESIRPKYSYTTLKARFNGWVNACAAFIEFKSDENAAAFNNLDVEQTGNQPRRRTEIRNKEKRNIPLKLRLDVLKRDKFRCVFCGSSPAIETGVVLHIDHKLAFSKGGKTTIENLQCLCGDCNLGKGKRTVDK